MRHRLALSCLLAIFFLSFQPVALPAQETQFGLKVPAGFEVIEYADSSLANDIYCMTVDPKGRIVVAGRGYIRILEDTNGNGRADRAIPFADSPKDGAMGLLWEGDTLYVTGDGGLRKFVDADGDGRADGPSQLIRAMKTGREHGAHAIRRGPDGWLYVLGGNNTDIDAGYAQLPTSPVKKPVAGCVLRFTPDLKKSEIVAHGFRNPYGMDFNLDGELFTYDSDNERCIALPWYEYTRFYHVIPGGFYGWLNPQHASFWRLPPYFVDVVAPVTTLDRGSPTGVACYRHVQFPKKYRGGMFALDWTFGKVYYLELIRDGSSYTCKKEVFLEAVGDNGFAPTDVVVHPKTGDLFICIGGRGTRGAVYRIRWKNAQQTVNQKELASMQLALRSLDWQSSLKEGLPKQASAGDKLQRLRALQLLTRHASKFTADQRKQAVLASWNDPDRYLRQAAAALLAALPEKERAQLAEQANKPLAKITLGLAGYARQPKEVLQRIRELLEETDDSQARLEGVRLLQLALGDVVSPRKKNQVWEGYSTRKPLESLQKEFGQQELALLLASLRKLFPANHADLDAELARTFALLEDSDDTTLEKVAKEMADTSHPVTQLHYLMVLGRLGAPRSKDITQNVTAVLLSLDEKLDQHQLHTDSNWTPRVKELYAELSRKDPKLNLALLQQKDFGRAAHALFALAPGFDVQAAAKVFLQKARKDDDYPWNASLVNIIGKLPKEQSFPEFRQLWGKAGLDSSILPILAKHPDEQDRAKFGAGLKSPQLSTVQVSLQALKKLPARAEGEDILALLTALNRLPKDKARALEQEIGAYLKNITGQDHGTDRKAWLQWFSDAHPALAAKLTNLDGVDVAAWKKRLARLQWNAGESKRGQLVFQKANCAACHSGGQALGPDLQGVAKRFSQEDLFWSIIQPSREVPERYQLTLFETTDGKIYQGLIIYEATDGVLLQTGATTTVRIPGPQIASKQPLPSSLMPAGLLDNLSDQEIVDLFAFLRLL